VTIVSVLAAPAAGTGAPRRHLDGGGNGPGGSYRPITGAERVGLENQIVALTWAVPEARTGVLR
jgi:hypothetical protein